MRRLDGCAAGQVKHSEELRANEVSFAALKSLVQENLMSQISL